MNRIKQLFSILTVIAFFSLTACLSFMQGDHFKADNEAFLSGENLKDEVFRVLITSDRYTVAQMKYKGTIKRVKDPGGDKYICDEMKRLDKINEAREGIMRLRLYPDSGRIMKVRPQKPLYLLELDKLITEDIQRWTFEFPKSVVNPTVLDIKYRIVLRKKLTDEEIIRDVQKKMRESQ